MNKQKKGGEENAISQAGFAPVVRPTKERIVSIGARAVVRAVAQGKITPEKGLELIKKI